MSEQGQGAGGGSMGMKHNYSCGSLAAAEQLTDRWIVGFHL